MSDATACPRCERGTLHPDPTGRAEVYCSRAGCGWAGAKPSPTAAHADLGTGTTHHGTPQECGCWQRLVARLRAERDAAAAGEREEIAALVDEAIAAAEKDAAASAHSNAYVAVPRLRNLAAAIRARGTTTEGDRG